MKYGDKKTFIYMPFLGFNEAAETMGETFERINQAVAKKEKAHKKMLRTLQKANPGKTVTKVGDTFIINSHS